MSGAVLYLATPCRDGRANLQFITSVLALQAACRMRGVGLHVELLAGDPLVARARSRLAAGFLARPEATHLLFVDSDIGFQPENVFRLLDCGKPVAGGVYPLKRIDWERVRAAAHAGAGDLAAAGLGYVVRFLPDPEKRIDVQDGFARVAYLGTGFLMIAREAAEAVAKAHPELSARLGELPGGLPDQAVMMFETMIEPETSEHLSEDYAFCRRWRDLGGEVWADVEAPLAHVGAAVYAGSLLSGLKPA